MQELLRKNNKYYIEVNILKKILKIIVPLLSTLVLLTACSSEKTKIYTKSIDNQDLHVTIYYKGDTVNKLVSENTLTVDGDDVKSAAESIKKSIKADNSKYFFLIVILPFHKSILI
mgnify:CR=1 FL=1